MFSRVSKFVCVVLFIARGGDCVVKFIIAVLFFSFFLFGRLLSGVSDILMRGVEGTTFGRRC